MAKILIHTSPRRRPGAIHPFAQALKWIPAFAGMTIFFIFAMPARANDEAAAAPETTATAPAAEAMPPPKEMENPFVYKPEGCEFQIDLPSEPRTEKRCNADDASICSNVTSFTKVFGLDATVDVSITCNKSKPDMYEEYTGDLMVKILTALTGRNQLVDYETAFKQHGSDIRQAVLIGTGREGASEKIYTSQLWISRNSIFSLEASLIGEAQAEADDMFANIIRSIRHESWPESGPPPDSETMEETPAQPPEKEGNAAPAKKE